MIHNVDHALTHHGLEGFFQTDLFPSPAVATGYAHLLVVSMAKPQLFPSVFAPKPIRPPRDSWGFGTSTGNPMCQSIVFNLSSSGCHMDMAVGTLVERMGLLTTIEGGDNQLVINDSSCNYTG